MKTTKRTNPKKPKQLQVNVALRGPLLEKFLAYRKQWLREVHVYSDDAPGPSASLIAKMLLCKALEQEAQ